MTPARQAGPGRGGARRPGPAGVLPLVLATALPLAACSSQGAAAPHSGSYEVATPGADVLATPVASAGHYQLVSAGDPVLADLTGARLVARASGPELTVPPGPPVDSAPGVLTVALQSERGAASVAAKDFLLLDEGRRRIRAHADAATARVSPSAPQVLHLSAQLPAGHATLTWRPAGRPMVTWDFVVEID